MWTSQSLEVCSPSSEGFYYSEDLILGLLTWHSGCFPCRDPLCSSGTGTDWPLLFGSGALPGLWDCWRVLESSLDQELCSQTPGLDPSLQCIVDLAFKVGVLRGLLCGLASECLPTVLLALTLPSLLLCAFLPQGSKRLRDTSELFRARFSLQCFRGPHGGSVSPGSQQVTSNDHSLRAAPSRHSLVV